MHYATQNVSITSAERFENVLGPSYSSPFEVSLCKSIQEG